MSEGQAAGKLESQERGGQGRKQGEDQQRRDSLNSRDST